MRLRRWCTGWRRRDGTLLPSGRRGGRWRRGALLAAWRSRRLRRRRTSGPTAWRRSASARWRWCRQGMRRPGPRRRGWRRRRRCRGRGTRRRSRCRRRRGRRCRRRWTRCRRGGRRRWGRRWRSMWRRCGRGRRRRRRRMRRWGRRWRCRRMRRCGRRGRRRRDGTRRSGRRWWRRRRMRRRCGRRWWRRRMRRRCSRRGRRRSRWMRRLGSRGRRRPARGLGLAALRGLPRFAVGTDLARRLSGLGDDDGCGLRKRSGACNGRRRERGRGKQHETNSGHAIFGPGIILGRAKNNQRLGRIVARFKCGICFISRPNALMRRLFHGAFRCRFPVPCWIAECCR